ncbi:LapD/MoxY N-terminal periplasmic domain-containing protein [Castellaniella defragrans]|uniref:GGDEF domain-containing protein/EAL domain-containing protein (Putative c-di-GMP-specific phosphodiesterase class I) n=1 Tax=Castellaniella defragrans TaxID=75697 RepID=A0A7W9WND3_CASDE|nr:LapD/MoxY N-terminal periplasmic domain-containing protein [Castellaniella defragrans]KAB0612043.1 EAL domain-containing protein [Castellaniella defragrans]MBB6083284.1 GGDEF domain-containing protein/EAL domain-containing protein (putative c-di-GMP-specific phosphodiesterase class I) [Castellaniella defragrans]
MSLLRQLLLSVTLAILVILAGAIIVSVGSARQYLDAQLQGQSDATATSLALTLSQPSNQDPTVRELLISVLFDSGQFRVIEFLDPTGRILTRRQKEDGRDSRIAAPDWFSHLLPLERHEAQRQVTNGWTQLGVVRLQADDAYARNALWANTVRIVLLTLGAGVLWGLFVLVLMRWLRQALQDDVTARVQAMADAAAGDDLPPVRHPAMVELREVARIITRTHEQVRATAAERQSRIESLELELNQDEVTGLANRKYFINELRRMLEPSAPDQGVDGHVMLFRQCDLQAVNQTMSRQVVDRWLRNMGRLVLEVLRERLGPQAWLARLNGSDFAFVLPMMPGPMAVRVAQAVGEILQAQRIQLGQAGLCRWRMVLTDFEPGEPLGDVLSRLDEALMRAESAGHTDVEYLPGEDLRSLTGGRGGGEQAWRTLLRNALDEDWFALATRRDPSAASEGRTLGLLTLHEPGASEPLSGYLFMPPAVRLGLSAACDLQAVGLGLGWLRTHPGDLVLRVSLASILHEEFRGELAGLLAEMPDQSARLLIDLDAYGLVAQRAQVVAFAAMLREHGVRLGLRRFAEQPEALLYLHEIRPEYLRVSGTLLAAQADSPGARRLLAAVLDTAREIGAVADLSAGS